MYLGAYEFKDLNIGKITPEWLFTNAYTDEIYKSEQVCTSTKILRTTLNAKNKSSDSSKAMKNIWQHWTEMQHNELLKWL